MIIFVCFSNSNKNASCPHLLSSSTKDTSLFNLINELTILLDWAVVKSQSVEKEINRYNALNKELLDQIQALQTEKTFLIQSYQNNPFRSEREVCDKINVLTMAIDDFKQQIEVNKSRTAALWYGYHERL